MRTQTVLAIASVLFVCLLVLGPTPTKAATPGQTAPDFAAIDAYVATLLQEARVPGAALGIVQGSRVLHLSGFGVAGPAGQPVTPQTPFIIGSTTKAFTALAVMQLAEAGKIDLDAPVQRYLPWFRVADESASARIAVRHLLNQTSGIPQGAGLAPLAGDGTGTVEGHVRALSAVTLNRAPGVAFEYSNANYLALGLIVEAASGQPYEQYMREHVFAPLAMRNSYTSQAEAQARGMATGYHWWFGLTFPANMPYLQDALPAGYLIASAEDMAHFLIANLDEGRYEGAALLSPSGIAELHQPPDVPGGASPYAMGWAVETATGTTLLTHEGSAADFSSAMALVPGEGWGVVLLTNAQGMFVTPTGHIARGALDMLRGRVPAGGTGVMPMYLIADAAMLLITVLVVRSLALLPRWRRQLRERRPKGVRGWAWRVALPAVLELGVPFVVFVFLPLGAGFPMWAVMAAMQPDFTYWILAMAAIFLVKGLARPVLALGASVRSS